MTDSSTRFVFRNEDVRGNVVRLEESFGEIISRHDYPPAITALLGEFLVAALLLSDTIKFRGRLILQAAGDGDLQFLMAEATHDGHTRGIARMAEGHEPFGEDADLQDILGNGTLTVTIEPEQGQRYQSVVPLSGTSLAACLEHYFRQSEQLNTFIRLAIDTARAVGILVQQLPAQQVTDSRQRADFWETVTVLAESVTRDELIREPAEVVIRHLFGTLDVLQVGSMPVAFSCSCSEERMAGALISLGGEQLDELFSETEALEIQCEFCGAEYRFDPEELTRWVTGDAPSH